MYGLITGCALIPIFLVSIGAENDTAIAVKETFDFDPRRIAEGVHSYKEFVRNSCAFVDKTLLLKEILTDTPGRVIALNYPSDFGKSLNLNMIKTFLEIEVDTIGNRILPVERTRNYRLFKNGEVFFDDGMMQKLEKPLLISKHDKIINDFLGQRPVIFLNLTNYVPGTHFDHSFLELVNRVSDAFAEHQYLREAFNDLIDDKNKTEGQVKKAEHDLEMFERILWKKGGRVDVQKSLNFLTNALARHFRKKVVMLVDGYDAPFNNTFLSRTFPKSHEITFFDFYRQFVFFTFVSNPNLKNAILTGVVPLTKGDLLFALNSATEITVLSNSTIHKYYGFSLDEAHQLYKLFNVDNDTIEKMHRFYEGYAVGYPARTTTLESASIVRVLNTGILKRADPQTDFCSTYFAVDSIRNAFTSLLSGMKLPVDFKNITLNKDDFKTLQNAPYYNEKRKGPVVRAFLKYSLAVGTLSLTFFEMLGNYTLRFSTSDLFGRLGERMGLFYTNKMGITPDSVRNISESFHHHLMAFAKSKALTSTMLVSILERFFSHVFRPFGFITNENEEMTHLVLDYLTIFVDSFKRYPSYGPTILLIDQDVGVVIEGTFNESSAYPALQKARDNERLFYPLSIPKMKYIGINVKPNSTVQFVGT